MTIFGPVHDGPLQQYRESSTTIARCGRHVDRSLLLLLSPASLHSRYYFALSQGHIFERWPAAGSNDDDKRKLMDQAIVLDSKYPGGLTAYVAKVCSLFLWPCFVGDGCTFLSRGGSSSFLKREVMGQAVCTVVLDSKYPGRLAAYVAKVCSLGMWRFWSGCGFSWRGFCQELPCFSLLGYRRHTERDNLKKVSVLCSVMLFKR